MIRLAGFLLALWLPLPAAAAAQPPVIEAHSYVLLDATSGQVLAAHRPDKRIQPAALTKLMTAYLSFQAVTEGRLQAEATLPVPPQALSVDGSRMFLDSRPVRVADLLAGLVVASGNDAALTLAEGIAGSQEGFVRLMNATAVRLGLRQTRFAGATGLVREGQYTTARDLALLGRALAQHFPAHYPLFGRRELSYNGITQPNRDRMLWRDPYLDGLKGGHTEEDGHLQVASARRGEMRLVAVIVGAAGESQRAAEAQKLLNYGFAAFETRRLYPPGAVVKVLPVFKGELPEVKAKLSQALYLTLPKGDFARLEASLITRHPLVAPLAANAQVGSLRLHLDGRVLAEHPLRAAQPVPLAGVFGRIWDSLRLIWI